MPGEIARTTGRTAEAVPPPAAVTAPEDQALAVYGNSLQIMQQHAKVLSVADMLPAQYRRNSGNVLWAMEYGKALGISPIAVMLEIWVTPDGKPTCSSKMMQALVRNRGHKLRLSAAADGQSATCTIVRKDDPDYPTVVTYTMKDAQTAKLTDKKNWRENPAAMLKARAAAVCCRDACAEVLLGMYTPDELGSDSPDDEAPTAGSYGPQEPARPVEEGPGSLASDERVKALVARFRAAPYKMKLDEIQDAVEIIIQPRREEPMPRPADLTVAECQLISDELDELPDRAALDAYLGYAQVAEEQSDAEAAGEET